MLPPWLGYVNGKGDGTVTSVTMLCYIKFLPYRLEGETLPLALKKQTACSEPACGERTIRLGASRPYPARISSQADTSKWKPKCESVNGSVLSDCLQLHALQPTRIFSPWNSPGKNTGVGSHFFSRISSQPRIEPRSPALGADSLPSEPPGRPRSKWILPTKQNKLEGDSFSFKPSDGNTAQPILGLQPCKTISSRPS